MKNFTEGAPDAGLVRPLVLSSFWPHHRHAGDFLDLDAL